MGKIICLSCENKDYSKNINIGQGMMFIPPEKLNVFFDKNSYQKMMTAVSAGKPVNSYRKAAFCKHCGDFVSVMVAEINDNEKKSCIVGIPECGGKSDDLIIFDEDSKEQICPECGGKIYIKTAGSWD